MNQDPLEPNREFLTREVDGETVTLNHYNEDEDHPEDWFVQIALGGQINNKHFSNKEDAEIYFYSVNHGVIAIVKQLLELTKKKHDLIARVQNKMSEALFRKEPLREDEAV